MRQQESNLGRIPGAFAKRGKTKRKPDVYPLYLEQPFKDVANFRKAVGHTATSEDSMFYLGLFEEEYREYQQAIKLVGTGAGIGLKDGIVALCEALKECVDVIYTGCGFWLASGYTFSKPPIIPMAATDVHVLRTIIKMYRYFEDWNTPLHAILCKVPKPTNSVSLLEVAKSYGLGELPKEMPCRLFQIFWRLVAHHNHLKTVNIEKDENGKVKKSNIDPLDITQAVKYALWAEG